MTKTKWIAIPVVAAALVLGGAQTGSVKAANNVATDISSKGHGHAKGHAKAHGHGHWRSAYAYHPRGANNPHFCPPGQAKKPGYGSRFHC